MIDGHTPTSVYDFKGIFDRGEQDSCPSDHVLSSLNIKTGYKKVQTRDGSELLLTANFNILRFHIYKKSGEADRLLILDDSGNLYDSTQGFTTPILTIGSMTDFSIITIFGRAYITPHNRTRGLPSEKVYVYQGSGVARAAAGLPPSGFTLGVATSATSGYVAAGDRFFAVCFETDTGFITAPGPAIFTRYTGPGDYAVDISNIPIGPDGTIARHLLTTAILPDDFDGNQNSLEYFFVPDAVIFDNVTTELNELTFYDTDLLDSADYLFDQLSEIPAGVGLTTYLGSLVVWGSNENDHTIYLSRANEPESVDGVDNLIQVVNDGTGGVKNCVEYRGSLFMHKDLRTYYTTDNGDVPSTWAEPQTLDTGIGTTPFGIAKVFDREGAVVDYYLIADRTAFRLMDGTLKTELSWKIANIWDRINPTAFDQIQVVLDPITKSIYISVALDDATSPSHVLVASYNEGMDPDNITWDIWQYPDAHSSIGLKLDFSTKVSSFVFSLAAGNLYRSDASLHDDYGTAIPWNIWLPKFTYSPEGADSQFVGLKTKAKGVGSVALTIYDDSNSNPVTPSQISLSLTPPRPPLYKFNYVSYVASFKLAGGFNYGDYILMTMFTVYGSPMWYEAPA